MADYDASQAGSNAADSGPIARPDVDSLPAGSMGPASGNTITGSGTITGQAGADTPGAGGASVVEVHGAGGATSGGNGNFQASGQYGVLSMDAQGNYNYVRNPGTPDGVRDVFQYTLADAQGANAASTLTIDIGQVLTANAGLVNLPAGVELSDIHVVGRDLVIDMPDGTHMVIPNGAVFVPQLSIGDVAVPASNVAALLIDSEPQPAAGNTPSSGGNFADPVPPLDPGVPLGDLIPPTELNYTPPDFEEIGQFIDREPTVVIVTPDNPAGAVNAHDQVEEEGLPARTIDGVAEPEGSNSSANSEQTSGTIVFQAEDGLDSVTVNGVVITAASVGTTITGDFGTLTITSVNLAAGQIGYTYAISDNTDPGGNGNHDDFTVIVTDSDGDVATGTLTIDIIDDVPTARNDTDTVDVQTEVAAGNVISGENTTSGSAGHDTVGADDATITGVSSNNVSGHSDTDAAGGFVVDGQYGTLTMDENGEYTYVLHDNAPGGSVDVFTYTLTDGDGDPSTATLTITNPDRPVLITNLTPQASGGDVIVDEDDLPDGSDTSKESLTVTGTFNISAPDGVDDLTVGGVQVIVNGVFQVGASETTPLGNTLTFTAYDPTTGQITYTYTLTDNEDHTSGNGQNSLFENFLVTLTDTDGDTDTDTLSVNIVDDVPTANPDTDALIGNDMVEEGNVITGVGTTSGGAGADVKGADNATVTSIQGAGGTDSTFENGVLEIHGEHGTLTIDAEGNYTYTRDPDSKEAGTDTFHYTITDGDGDPSTSTLTITLPDINSVPEIGRAEDLSVDEDGLVSANDDNNQSNPTEADHGGNLTDSGTVTVEYGNDPPANLPAAIEFTNPGALNGQLTQNGTPIVFFLEGGNLVGHVGSQSGDAVITIAFTSATDNGGGQVVYGYTVTLSGEVDQAYPNGDQTEAGIDLAGIQFNVTDSDGEHAATPGSFDVTIYDDVPSIAVGGDTTVTEGGTASGTWSEVVGADVPGSTVVLYGGNSYALGSPINTGDGTLTVFANGTWTFEAADNVSQPASVTFSVQVTDADGDHMADAQTVTINDGAGPEHGAPITLLVDDEALSDGSNSGSGAEQDSDTLSFTAGSDDITSIGFSTDLSGLGGGLNWTWVSATEIQGWDGPVGTGIKVITLTLNAPSSIAAGDSDTVTVTATLNNNYDSHPGVNVDDLQNLGSVGVVASETDGDSTTGTVNVGVSDDLPTIDVTGATSVTEGATATGTWSETVGADNPGTTVVVFGGNTYALGDAINTGKGTLTVNSDGTWSFTAANNIDNSVAQSITFTVKVIDADNDTDTDSQTITINDGAGPGAGGTVNLTVNEYALDTTKDSADLQAGIATGTNPGSTTETNVVSSVNGLHFTTGSDSLVSVAFNSTVAALNAISVSGLQVGQTITWSVSSGQLIGTLHEGATNLGTAIIVSLTGDTGATAQGGTANVGVTATLVGPLDHTNTSISITGIDVIASQADGDVGHGTVNVTVSDDTPVLGTIQPITSDNNPTDTNGTIHDGQGSLHLTSGADGFGTVVIDPDLSGITVGQHALYGEMTSATVYTAYADLDDSGDISDGDTPVFTITVSPTGGTGGTWTFDLLQALDPTITPFDIGAGSSFGVGPSNSVVVTDDATGLNLVYVTGYQPTGGFTGGEEAAWLAGGTPDLTQQSEVNGSTAGWGLFNNNFDGPIGPPKNIPGEFLRFDFGTLNDYDGAGGPYTVPAGAPTIENVAYATFSFFNFGDGDTIEFVAHYTNGTTETFTLVDGEADTLTITAPAGAQIAWIDAYQSEGSIKLNLDQVGVFSSNIDKTIPVDFTFTDGDGDPVTGSSSIHITNSGTATTPNAVVNTMMATTSTMDTSHLVSTNDNHRGVEHRGLEEARVVNAALLGAIAGAGLTSAHQVAAESFHATAMHDTSFGRSAPLQTLSDSHLTVREAATSDLALQPTHVVSGDQQLASASLSHAGDAGMGHGLAGHESVVQHAMSQLLAATSGPAMGHGPAPMAAAAIAIPPAQMLAAHMGVDKGGAEAQNVTAVQSNAVVGKVLADSLAGGHAHGPNIDTLLSHVAAGHGHGGAPDALAALASHDAGGVSFGHSGGFAGFHAAPLMEQMMIHQDAAATQNS